MSDIYEEETVLMDEETVEEEMVIPVNTARQRLEAIWEEKRLRGEIEDFLDE